MALQERISFLLLFFTMWSFGLNLKCEKLDNRLQQLCSKMDAGYNFTASFASENGVRYQDKAFPKVSHLQSLFRTCSNVSKLMICTKFVPKCSEDRSNPILPCREVCERFVVECERKLEESNLKVFYSTLCSVLPEEKESYGKCIKPKGFVPQLNAKKIGMSLSCLTQTIPACKHGNYSLLPDDIKIKLVKNLGQEDALVKSACAEQMRSYSCYHQTTPCFKQGNIPYRPCRSFCERLNKECESEIRLFNLSFPLCDELSERDRVSDLCRMDSWIVPWPNITKKAIKKPLKTCYCDTCSMTNNTCQTNGTCFIQSRLTSLGLSYIQQTCLQTGKDMDFICRYTKEYPYAKCCDQDYCNKDLDWMSHELTITGIPTSLPVTRLNLTFTETAPSTIVVSAKNSSSMASLYAGTYTSTINGLALVLATILQH